MKTSLKHLAVASVFALAVTSTQAQVASDNGGNYGAGWTNGANGGTGFEAWVITVDQSSGFSGNFIGDPASAGISGMATNSFGLYANPNGSGASVTATRELSSALSIGDTFSFQWGMNWDSGFDGNKGFSLFTGGISGTELVNVNNAGSGTITFNGDDTGFAYGTLAMEWSFTLTDATTLSVFGTARDGGSPFSTNITVSGAVDSFGFYASQMQGGDNAQPYFNNLEVVPEPSTYALLALSAMGFAGYVARRRARK